MSIQEIKDYINRTIPDRANPGAPTYKAGIIREMLFKLIDFAAGLIDFVTPNGDGFAISPQNLPGQGVLKILGNLLTGLSEVSLLNANLVGDGFSFWQVLTAKSKTLLLALRKQGVGIGTDKPEELLHVAGRIKSFGLVASGGTPTIAKLGDGLGSAGSVVLGTDATDQAGSLTITTSTNPQGGLNQTFARIVFSNAMARKPRVVLLSPASGTACLVMSKLFLVADSPATLVLLANANGEPLPANSSFTFFYQVII